MSARSHRAIVGRVAILRGSIIVTAFVAMSFLFTGRATAGEYSINIYCEHLGAVGTYWLAPPEPGVWRKTCLEGGTGSRFEASQSMNGDAPQVEWRFPAVLRPEIAIDQVDLYVRGSDGSAAGLQQGLRLAGKNPPAGSPAGSLSYGPFATITSPSTTTLQLFKLYGNAVPGGADRLVFSGKCVATTCEQGLPFEIVQMIVKFRDVTPPQISISPDFGSQSPSNPWTGIGGTITTFVLDQGSGVNRLHYTNATAGGIFAREWTDNGVNCPTYAQEPYFCGSSVASLSRVNTASIDHWYEGKNNLHATAYDKAGNMTTRSFSFSVDLVPPEQPFGLKFTNERHPGWLPSTTATLSWKNLGETLRTETQSGLRSFKYDLIPLDGQTDPGPRTETIGQAVDSSVPITFPSTGGWRIDVNVLDAVGNSSLVATKTVQIDTRSPAKPTLDVSGWYGPLRKMVGWSAPAAGPEICDYELRVGVSDWEPTGNKLEHSVMFGAEEGVNEIEVRAVSCAGIMGAPDVKPIDFDRAAPTVEAKASRGWIAGHEAVSLSATDSTSGVAAMRYWVDGDEPQTHNGSQLTLSLPGGEHVVNVEATDNAGNRSEPVSAHVFIDDIAPSGWVDSFDPLRPTLITGVVSDTQSGLARSAIEVRPSGGSVWIELETESVPVGTGAARLQARFPDTTFADGLYEVRLVAGDHAGKNLVTGPQRLDGAPATLLMPLRTTPKVELATVERRVVRCGGSKTKSKKKCVREREIDDLTVDYGKTSRVRGRVTTKDGLPAANLDVELHADEEPIDGRHIPEGSARTGPDGRFEATISAGVNRKIAARTAGTELHLPAEDSTIVRTRTGVSLSSNRRRVRPGQRVTLKGQVQLGRAKLSNLGMHVLITAADGELSIRDRRTDKNGRFAIPYVIPRFGRPVALKLKASVRHEYGWPYAAGSSRTITIRVSR